MSAKHYFIEQNEFSKHFCDLLDNFMFSQNPVYFFCDEKICSFFGSQINDFSLFNMKNSFLNLKNKAENNFDKQVSQTILKNIHQNKCNSENVIKETNKKTSLKSIHQNKSDSENIIKETNKKTSLKNIHQNKSTSENVIKETIYKNSGHKILNKNSSSIFFTISNNENIGTILAKNHSINPMRFESINRVDNIFNKKLSKPTCIFNHISHSQELQFLNDKSFLINKQMRLKDVNHKIKYVVFQNTKLFLRQNQNVSYIFIKFVENMQIGPNYRICEIQENLFGILISHCLKYTEFFLMSFHLLNTVALKNKMKNFFGLKNSINKHILENFIENGRKKSDGLFSSLFLKNYCRKLHQNGPSYENIHHSQYKNNNNIVYCHNNMFKNNPFHKNIFCSLDKNNKNYLDYHNNMFQNNPFHINFPYRFDKNNTIHSNSHIKVPKNIFFPKYVTFNDYNPNQTPENGSNVLHKTAHIPTNISQHNLYPQNSFMPAKHSNLNSLNKSSFCNSPVKHSTLPFQKYISGVIIAKSRVIPTNTSKKHPYYFIAILLVDSMSFPVYFYHNNCYLYYECLNVFDLIYFRNYKVVNNLSMNFFSYKFMGTCDKNVKKVEDLVNVSEEQENKTFLCRSSHQNRYENSSRIYNKNSNINCNENLCKNNLHAYNKYSNINCDKNVSQSILHTYNINCNENVSQNSLHSYNNNQIENTTKNHPFCSNISMNLYQNSFQSKTSFLKDFTNCSSAQSNGRTTPTLLEHKSHIFDSSYNKKTHNFLDFSISPNTVDDLFFFNKNQIHLCSNVEIYKVNVCEEKPIKNSVMKKEIKKRKRIKKGMKKKKDIKKRKGIKKRKKKLKVVDRKSKKLLRSKDNSENPNKKDNISIKSRKYNEKSMKILNPLKKKRYKYKNIKKLRKNKRNQKPTYTYSRKSYIDRVFFSKYPIRLLKSRFDYKKFTNYSNQSEFKRVCTIEKGNFNDLVNLCLDKGYVFSEKNENKETIDQYNISLDQQKSSFNSDEYVTKKYIDIERGFKCDGDMPTHDLQTINEKLDTFMSEDLKNGIKQVNNRLDIFVSEDLTNVEKRVNNRLDTFVSEDLKNAEKRVNNRLDIFMSEDLKNAEKQVERVNSNEKASADDVSKLINKIDSMKNDKNYFTNTRITDLSELHSKTPFSSKNSLDDNTLLKNNEHTSFSSKDSLNNSTLLKNNEHTSISSKDSLNNSTMLNNNEHTSISSKDSLNNSTMLKNNEHTSFSSKNSSDNNTLLNNNNEHTYFSAKYDHIFSKNNEQISPSDPKNHIEYSNNTLQDPLSSKKIHNPLQNSDTLLQNALSHQISPKTPHLLENIKNFAQNFNETSTINQPERNPFSIIKKRKNVGILNTSKLLMFVIKKYKFLYKSELFPCRKKICKLHHSRTFFINEWDINSCVDVFYKLIKSECYLILRLVKNKCLYEYAFYNFLVDYVTNQCFYDEKDQLFIETDVIGKVSQNTVVDMDYNQNIIESNIQLSSEKNKRSIENQPNHVIETGCWGIENNKQGMFERDGLCSQSNINNPNYSENKTYNSVSEFTNTKDSENKSYNNISEFTNIQDSENKRFIVKNNVYRTQYSENSPSDIQNIRKSEDSENKSYTYKNDFTITKDSGIYTSDIQSSINNTEDSENKGFNVQNDINSTQDLINCLSDIQSNVNSAQYLENIPSDSQNIIKTEDFYNNLSTNKFAFNNTQDSKNSTTKSFNRETSPNNSKTNATHLPDTQINNPHSYKNITNIHITVLNILKTFQKHYNHQIYLTNLKYFPNICKTVVLKCFFQNEQLCIPIYKNNCYSLKCLCLLNLCVNRSKKQVKNMANSQNEIDAENISNQNSGNLVDSHINSIVQKPHMNKKSILSMLLQKLNAKCRSFFLNTNKQHNLSDLITRYDRLKNKHKENSYITENNNDLFNHTEKVENSALYNNNKSIDANDFYSCALQKDNVHSHSFLHKKTPISTYLSTLSHLTSITGKVVHISILYTQRNCSKPFITHNCSISQYYLIKIKQSSVVYKVKMNFTKENPFQCGDIVRITNLYTVFCDNFCYKENKDFMKLYVSSIFTDLKIVNNLREGFTDFLGVSINNRLEYEYKKSLKKFNNQNGKINSEDLQKDNKFQGGQNLENNKNTEKYIKNTENSINSEYVQEFKKLEEYKNIQESKNKENTEESEKNTQNSINNTQNSINNENIQEFKNKENTEECEKNKNQQESIKNTQKSINNTQESERNTQKSINNENTGEYKNNKENTPEFKNYKNLNTQGTKKYETIIEKENSYKNYIQVYKDIHNKKRRYSEMTEYENKIQFNSEPTYTKKTNQNFINKKEIQLNSEPIYTKKTNQNFINKKEIQLNSEPNYIKKTKQDYKNGNSSGLLNFVKNDKFENHFIKFSSKYNINIATNNIKEIQFNSEPNYFIKEISSNISVNKILEENNSKSYFLKENDSKLISNCVIQNTEKILEISRKIQIQKENKNFNENIKDLNENIKDFNEKENDFSENIKDFSEKEKYLDENKNFTVNVKGFGEKENIIILDKRSFNFLDKINENDNKNIFVDLGLDKKIKTKKKLENKNIKNQQIQNIFNKNVGEEKNKCNNMCQNKCNNMCNSKCNNMSNDECNSKCNNECNNMDKNHSKNLTNSSKPFDENKNKFSKEELHQFTSDENKNKLFIENHKKSKNINNLNKNILNPPEKPDIKSKYFKNAVSFIPYYRNTYIILNSTKIRMEIYKKKQTTIKDILILKKNLVINESKKIQFKGILNSYHINTICTNNKCNLFKKNENQHVFISKNCDFRNKKYFKIYVDEKKSYLESHRFTVSDGLNIMEILIAKNYFKDNTSVCDNLGVFCEKNLGSVVEMVCDVLRVGYKEVHAFLDTIELIN